MGVGSGVLFTIMCVCTQKISGVRKFCDFSYVLFTIDSYEFSYGRAAHDDRIMGVHGHLWACLFISDQKRLVC